MVKPKGKSPDDFVWRSNLLKEKRQMRKKRNEKKKRKLIEKKRRLKEEEVRAAVERAQVETKQYKKLATKYLGLWKRATQRKDDKITASQSKMLPKIKRADLTDVNENETTSFGKGVYGKCYLKMYQGHLVVAKEFRDKVTPSEVIKEANMLAALSHAGLPVVLGVDMTQNPLIMVTLFYGLDGSNTTFENVLTVDDQPEFVGLIRQLCEILKYLHVHKILHNDIKCDNVMIYRDREGLKCVLIDFGKACKIEEGKHKKLTNDQKTKYRERHSHIAPEVVDGKSPQTTLSDIFALGRIIFRIGTRYKCDKIVALSKLCTSENPAKRSTLSFLIEECDVLYKLILD